MIFGISLFVEILIPKFHWHLRIAHLQAPANKMQLWHSTMIGLPEESLNFALTEGIQMVFWGWFYIYMYHN